MSIPVINQISDNVGYIDFELPSKSGKITKCRVVNAYGPTTPTAADKDAVKIVDGVKYVGGKQIVKKYYSELSAAVSVPKNYELFVCGDMNAKIGKLSQSDIELGISNHVGKYCIGTRNPNGSKLLDFVIFNDLFVTNTAFKHKSRHLTTREGRVKDWSDPNSNKSKPFYSMIDYVICRSRFKSTLVNSRAYGGTRVDSDHKLVCGRFQFTNRYLTFPQHTKSVKKFDCNTLSANPDIQIKYSTALSEMIMEKSDECVNGDIDCNTKIDRLVSSLRDVAKEVVGLKPKQTHRDFTNDEEVVKMSDERHKLRMLLKSSNVPADTRSIRTRINKLKNLIKKRLTQLKELRAHELAERIESTDESRRMFEAVRELKTNNM